MPKGSPIYSYMMEQYANKALNIRVKEGDVVLDCGGCWGDTALYFASLAGPRGQIISFEFLPENLQVFTKNLELNPQIASSIEIVTKPVWNSSGVSMNFSSSGPASRVTPGAASNSHVSVSIDDELRKRNLEHLDFIKMDIEGSEFEALQGAIETLRRYKPDLALCVYHSREDFTRLARFVYELNLGYRFALGHFTFHAEETVLYASAR
jgi:FkbM family methyltransferase